MRISDGVRTLQQCDALHVVGHRKDADGVERERDPLRGGCAQEAKPAPDLRRCRSRGLRAQERCCEALRIKASPFRALLSAGSCIHKRPQRTAHSVVLLLCSGSVRTIHVGTFGEHLGSNGVAVERSGNACVRGKVDECLHDLLWRHPIVQSDPELST